MLIISPNTIQVIKLIQVCLYLFKIFCDDVPFFQRFISIDLGSLFSIPFADLWQNSNIPTYIFQSSLFGKFTYKVPSVLPVILLLLNIFLIVCSLASMLLLIFNKSYSKSIHYDLPSLWSIIMLSYI